MTIDFGVFTTQGWKTELQGVEGAAQQWQTLRDTATAAEAAGYDSVWVYDHFHPIPDPTSGDPVFECWTTVAALAEATSTIRLGQMVGCMGYRNPALLAKMVATVDVISGGRVDWGIGAGWYWHEYQGYGFEWGEPKERIGRLREGVEIIKSLWTNERTDYDGTWYSLTDARCDPKPLQDPHPPIWIGGAGEQLTLRVTARHADRSNFGGKLHEFTHKNAVLDGHCEAVGRDPSEIVRTLNQDLIIGADDAAVASKLSARMQQWEAITGEAEDSYRQGHLVGTPNEIVDRIGSYVEAGAGAFVFWMPDFPSHESLELFATEVMPQVRDL